MKTTKKGFTLLELIVVIAIIGVLAAILAPTLLGNIKKSRIQSACADAKTMMTLANQALAELDEEGVDPGVNNAWLDSAKWSEDGDSADILDRMASFGDAAKTAKFSVYIKDGAAVCAAAKNGKYYGCYPGQLSKKNYDEKNSSGDAAGAKAMAIAFYNAEHATADQISGGGSGGDSSGGDSEG